MNVTISDLSWKTFSQSELGNAAYILALLRKLKWTTSSHLDSWKGTNIAWVVAAVLGLLTLKSILFTTRRFIKDKYPPGPPALPLIGNLHQLSLDAWIPFTQWKDQYGPIVYLSVAGQPVVVLNTSKAAADLFDRRADIYSDRPDNIVASGMLCGGIVLVFMHFNDLWRRMRRAAHEALGGDAIENYCPTQVTEALILTDGLLKTPNGWDGHMRKSAASTIMSIVYAHPPIKSEDEPSVVLINNFVERIVRAAYPGAHFVEFFTWMKYLPEWAAKWKREAMSWYRHDSVFFVGLYNDVQKHVEAGDERPSFSSYLVQQGDRYGLDSKESAFLAATNYAAGAETISGAMAWFWLAIVAFPDIQKKAQAELDEVVGRHRLPTFADYPRLQYIRALVKESLRWKTVDPLGVPRRVMEDDVYEGYLIPKGAICIANVWAINRDPEIYGPDADKFNPSRHLDEKGQLKPAPADTKEESHVTYGFGKRICLGRHIANNSMFINIAMILFCLDIEPLRDAPPDTEGSHNTGLVVRPLPFGCVTRLRFPDAEAMLAQAMDDLGL